MKKTFRCHYGEISVKTEPIKRKDKLRQLFVKVASENKTVPLHQCFTETSPDYGVLSLESCRHGVGKMSAALNNLCLLPHIADCKRKSLVQFDIPSSYLYVVVLKDL